MEVLLVVMAITIAVLGLAGFVFAFLVIKIIVRVAKGIDLNEPTQPLSALDNLTPQEGNPDDVPIENFTPDFKKPVKVKFKEEDEQDQITPLEDDAQNKKS